VILAPARADLWAGLGETFVAEGQGEIGTDARKAFAEALKRDPPRTSAPAITWAWPGSPTATVQGGLADWKALLADLPPDDPRRMGFGHQIAQVEADGGLPRLRRPHRPARRGVPQGADVQDMIQGMVAGLAAGSRPIPTIPTAGSSWCAPIAVLGDAARRDAALAKAQARYKDQPKVLAALRQAAQTPSQKTQP
jgi:cytochrome c-type biogenesis protein CcmH